MQELINKAILASVAARREWDLKPVQDRAQILFKAADALSGPKRAEVIAKTMIGQVRQTRETRSTHVSMLNHILARPHCPHCLSRQGKTVIQAEIDAAAELIDFFRFNAKHAIELQDQQPLDAPGSTNTMLYRGLEVRPASL